MEILGFVSRGEELPLAMVCADWCEILKAKRKKRSSEKCIEEGWTTSRRYVLHSTATAHWAVEHGCGVTGLVMDHSAMFGPKEVFYWMTENGF